MKLLPGTAKALIANLVVSIGILCQSDAAFVIDSLSGDITQNEINNFVSTIAGRNPATNNWGNAMATHGTEPEGMWRMYEATGNVTILNHYIRWMDVILAHRNDMPLGEGRVMWEGTVAPCWPNIAPGDPNEGYAGCETGMIAGYIALCAKSILETPSIWSTTVPDGNPNGFGVTYHDRAMKYLEEVDYVCETYLRVWFVNPANNRIRKPTDSRWASDAGAEAVTAWNRQWLFLMAFLNSARCHDLLGDNPSYLATYKDIVKQFAIWFVAPYPTGGGVYYTTGGHDVVKWYYEVPTNQNIENMGHAQHDVAALFDCYDSPYSTLTYDQVQPFADATQYVLNKGATNSWSDTVDGAGSSTYLKTDFIFLSQWNRALYTMIAQSNIDASQLNVDEGCKNTGYILWMKHWMCSSPVARYTFDNGTAGDSSGNGNNGTLVNGASVVSDADMGNVLLLDGVNDYVDLGNAASLNLSGNSQATITAWVKMAAGKVHNSILTKGAWNDAYSLVIKGDSSPQNKLWTGNDTGVNSADAIAANVWTHVAVTINGDLTTFYINGQINGTANQDRGNPIDNLAAGVNLGREQTSTGRWYFNGRLDDVRIYDTALTQAEIQNTLPANPNTAPVLAAIGNKTVNEGSQLSFTATATDTDIPAQAITFSLDAGAPSGASINASSGAFTWTPTEAQGAGVYNVTVRITDNGSPSMGDSETIQITVNEVNIAPVLAGIGNKSVNEGSAVTFTASATDSDTPTQSLTYSLDSGAPSGASINASSGAFTWTPTESQGPSTPSVTVRVTDSLGGTDAETIQITVAEVNVAPVLAAIGNKTGTTGTALTFTASATDSDLPTQTRTYSLDSGAPGGASINSSTGAFTWTPSGAGTSNITVRVTDSLGATDFETIQVVVSDVGGGLLADYYDNSDFTGTIVTRADATVNFNWGTTAPDAALGADTFSARWTGQVRPLYSQTYTFYTTTDDGVRLWVNGQLLIDKWINQGSTEWSGTITLVADQKSDIKMEYYDNTGGAVASLSWSSSSQTKQIVPQSRLYLPAALPAPWLTTDIGTVSETGTAVWSGVYTVTGAGADIWGTSDHFRFVYQSLSGDGEIKARVSSETGPSTYTKVGVMIRESLNSNSANAMMTITPTTNNGFYFQRRLSTGASSTQAVSSPLNTAPNNWVRVVRSGTTLTGYKSADGVTWTEVGNVTISMATNIYIGLGVCAHNSTGVGTGVFDNIVVVP